MSARGKVWRLLLLSALAAALAACAPAQTEAAHSSLLDRAAAEATAIVEQAQATAMVLQARAQATAALAPPPETTQTPAETLSPVARSTSSTGPHPLTTRQAVEVVGVGIAAEGGIVMVRFRAPPSEAETWWQGSVSVTEEDSGQIYNEIMVMPKLGPLISRPRRDGDQGYVMLVNHAPRVARGARVTVVLGNHRFEHLVVQ